MFGLGWSEILLIAVVALVVLGPERLPKVARSAGLWVGRIQNFVNNVKTELSTQTGVAEFREARDSIEAAARSFQQDLDNHVRGLRGEVDALKRQVQSEQNTINVSNDSLSADIIPVTPTVVQQNLLPMHQVSLRRQAMQRKRDMRPRRSVLPKLRVRRHR